MLTRAFFLGPAVVASLLELLTWGDNFFKLGFLPAGGLVQGAEPVAAGGAFLPSFGCTSPPASLLKTL